MKTPNKTLLYQFAISHYCEKVRWALEYKKISHETVNLLPGPHLLTTRKLAPQSSVPILNNKGKIIQDSTAILSYLDELVPEPSLIPEDVSLKKETLELEEYFDQEVGMHLRRFVYYYVLPDRKLATFLLLQQGPRYGSLLYFFIFPLLRKLMSKSMNICPESAKRSEARLVNALEFLSQRIQNNRFLVGNQFSRADLTAASLLAPLCTPPQHTFGWPPDEKMPRPLVDFKNAHRQKPFFQWVLGMYQNFRSPSLQASRVGDIV